MLAWAWRGKVAVERGTAQFVAVMALRGFVPAKGKGKHRRKRERRPLPGMLVHQDGSRFAWLAWL